MHFEWDHAKSDQTNADRGLDFTFATRLWADDNGVEFPARSDTEPRWARIARVDGSIYVVFFTMRRERVRIISVRRARPNEEKVYG